MDKYELIDFLRNNLSIECDIEDRLCKNWHDDTFHQEMFVAKLMLNVDGESVEISRSEMGLEVFTNES